MLAHITKGTERELYFVLYNLALCCFLVKARQNFSKAYLNAMFEISESGHVIRRDDTKEKSKRMRVRLWSTLDMKTFQTLPKDHQLRRIYARSILLYCALWIKSGQCSLIVATRIGRSGLKEN
jgi:hypothetical protein